MYERLRGMFFDQPLALLPSKAHEVAAFLSRKGRGEQIDPAQIKAATDSRRRPAGQIVGRIGCISVFGVLAQRVSLLEEASGGISTEQIGAQLDSLVRDPAVDAVAMIYDSPGGSVFGVQELGEKIHSLRGSKPIYGVADSLAASAGYWLLSQCSEAWCTPGGQVGSLGVLSMHEDVSGYMEQIGVKTTLVAAGPFKTEGNPFEPLTEAARAEMQQKVDHYFGVFVSAVAAALLDLHHWSDIDNYKLLWAGAALVGAVGMFYRYLKFFRLYTMEVFNSYAELKQDKPKQEPTH
jgi:signal peptide peptidase SppA